MGWSLQGRRLAGQSAMRSVSSKSGEFALSSLHTDILAAYGSFETPSHHFATNAKVARVRQEVDRILPSDVFCEDQTDLNYDAAVTLKLSRNESEVLLLLSLIGRYATVLLPTGAKISPLSAIGLEADRWRDVTRAVEDGGWQILRSKTLREKIPLSLDLCGASKCTVFNALFWDQHVTEFEA